MRLKGRITSWNDEKGYGFITPMAGDGRVFIHIKAFGNRDRRPEVNQLVTYAVSKDKQGRPRAVKATLAGDRLLPARNSTRGWLSILGAGIFLATLAALTVSRRLPSLILVLYAAASLLTFTVYALDKAAAKKGAWRTPESTLHMLALVGGWPGALIAQQKLRHKSKKQSFRFVFLMTVVMNCGILFWLLTPAGASALKAVLGVLSNSTYSDWR